jgi:hypothetical protein
VKPSGERLKFRLHLGILYRIGTLECIVIWGLRLLTKSGVGRCGYGERFSVLTIKFHQSDGGHRVERKGARPKLGTQAVLPSS